jgi:hypothetical protein
MFNPLKDLSILVIGYDPYSDIWPTFDAFYKKSRLNGRVPCVFASSSRVIRFSSDIISVACENPFFSSRLRAGLVEIKTKYVLVLLDDYIITRLPSDNEFGSLLSLFEETDADFCSIYNFCGNVNGKQIGKIGKFHIKQLGNQVHYRINLQPALWKTSFLKQASLLQFLRPHDFEAYFSETEEKKELKNNHVALTIQNGLFKFCNLINGGKLSHSGLRLMKENQLDLPQYKSQSRLSEHLFTVKTKIIRLLPRWIRRTIKTIGRKFGKHYYSN